MKELSKRISVLAAGHDAVDFYLPVISLALPVLIPIFALQGITSYAMVGFLVTIITIILAVMQPIAGWIQDRGGWTLGASWCGLLVLAVAARPSATRCFIKMPTSRSISFPLQQTAEHCSRSFRLGQFQVRGGTTCCLISAGLGRTSVPHLPDCSWNDHCSHHLQFSSAIRTRTRRTEDETLRLRKRLQLASCRPDAWHQFAPYMGLLRVSRVCNGLPHHLRRR